VCVCVCVCVYVCVCVCIPCLFRGRAAYDEIRQHMSVIHTLYTSAHVHNTRAHVHYTYVYNTPDTFIIRQHMSVVLPLQYVSICPLLKVQYVSICPLSTLQYVSISPLYLRRQYMSKSERNVITVYLRGQYMSKSERKHIIHTPSTIRQHMSVIYVTIRQHMQYMSKSANIRTPSAAQSKPETPT